ncbi:MAG: ribosome maturation factor RimP [Bdellovibrio sp.]
MSSSQDTEKKRVVSKEEASALEGSFEVSGSSASFFGESSVNPVLEKIRPFLQEIMEREALILYDMNFVNSSQGRTLQVFIDRDRGGVSLEDCERVSQALSLRLDVEDVIQGHYSLEVSSPGLERPLRLPWHFEKAQGKKIWVKARQSLRNYGVQEKGILNSRSLEAFLEAFDGTQVQVQGCKIPLHEIEEAHMVFEIQKGEKKSLNK